MQWWAWKTWKNLIAKRLKNWANSTSISKHFFRLWRMRTMSEPAWLSTLPTWMSTGLSWFHGGFRLLLLLNVFHWFCSSTNSDGFTPLDISLMLLNKNLIKFLQSCGAKEGESCKFLNVPLHVTEHFFLVLIVNTRTNREYHLNFLLTEARRYVEDLSACAKMSQMVIISSGGTLSTAPLNTAGLSTGSRDKDRQLSFWTRRHNLLVRLKKGFDALGKCIRGGGRLKGLKCLKRRRIQILSQEQFNLVRGFSVLLSSSSCDSLWISLYLLSFLLLGRSYSSIFPWFNSIQFAHSQTRMQAEQCRTGIRFFSVLFPSSSLWSGIIQFLYLYLLFFTAAVPVCLCWVVWLFVPYFNFFLSVSCR